MSTINKIITRYAKATTLVAFIALRLGTSITAFAQGLPPGTVPAIYGSQVFHNQPYHNKMIFAQIIDKFKQRRAVAQSGAISTNGK